MVRSSTSNYNKVALINDLKLAGFEESITYTIVDQVEEKKSNEWTQDMGRQEALRQAQILLQKSHSALDTFRTHQLLAQLINKTIDKENIYFPKK